MCKPYPTENVSLKPCLSTRERSSSKESCSLTSVVDMIIGQNSSLVHYWCLDIASFHCAGFYRQSKYFSGGNSTSFLEPQKLSPTGDSGGLCSQTFIMEKASGLNPLSIHYYCPDVKFSNAGFYRLKHAGFLVPSLTHTLTKVLPQRLINQKKINLYLSWDDSLTLFPPFRLPFLSSRPYWRFDTVSPLKLRCDRRTGNPSPLYRFHNLSGQRYYFVFYLRGFPVFDSIQ